MTIKNRLAGFLAAPAVAAAVFAGALTLAGPASADVSTNTSSGGTSSGAHPNTEIVVTPNTYARPSVFVPWPGWYN
ncbi:hypothetical protein FHT40_006364 [Mycolicibacterium sp. BK556]|uniref:hypothetical protein n=1 Tax=Mycobacteriaceae TaxID=1762 RepID=UPI00105EF172|nr:MULTISPECIES: hypothetical protein [Mycobacteriaceae]MBB3606671.1 hypothetical protein [Mycolicibacterium sp. BK556]MBB3636663.1 hypothetical protein [Mycolicibacterium sp. BK607]MBB3754251.1 hypothetical protein [Mycolicibacterium sp. BK634]TDO17107.1 hypothetical protein EV580_0273 [Mycobacterium sp. BK086]